MEKEGYAEPLGFACLFESNKLLFVEADVVGSVFCTNKIEACLVVSQSPSLVDYVSLTAYKIGELLLQLNALLHLFLHHLLWD
jgi:hypothetical protein